MIKFKKAFTMVELVMVIVVIAILAAMSIPRLKRDTRIEAINHILMAMRYAQNTALHDDKNGGNLFAQWERSYWRFGINKCSDGGIYYYIGTDADYNGAINNNESLVDPANGKMTNYNSANPCAKPSSVVGSNISPNIFLSHKYGIGSVNVVNGNNIVGGRNLFVVGFDNFGRPMDKRYINSNTPNHAGYMTSDVNITFSFQDSSIAPFTITIPKETGYAYLAENPKL